jgi:spore coat protein CotH
MKRNRTLWGLMLMAILAINLTGCGSPASAGTQPASGNTTLDNDGTTVSEVPEEESAETGEEAVVRAENWNEATHSKAVEPDYSVVFPQDSVNRISITISAEEWDTLLTEMTELFGEQGDGTTVGGMGGRENFGNPPVRGEGQQPPADGTMPAIPEGMQPPSDGTLPAMPEGQQPPGGGAGRPEGGMGMGAMDIGGDTSYVPSTIAFNGETWESVGLRFSGNSTLATSWSNGTLKISLRLDFDEFEDDDPATTDQRFYGFKQISLKSNAMDESYLREKVAADVFSEAGVVSSQTAFYEVYVDYGEGSQYFGLYTAVEIVDDTLIETQFEEDSGNIYKPEGTGASFAAGTFDEVTFEKKSNEDEADWSDIQAVFEALHAETRTTDPAAWRAGLEAVFDVDAFLKWLAVDTIMQNWDTYGSMAHNYYLYTNPTTGRVTWIPWDNNMSLSAGRGGGRGDTGKNGMGGGARELDLAAVTDQWPLIRYLADDSVYMAKYQQYLQETITSVFVPQKMAEIYQTYHDLIAPYVTSEVTGYTQLESIETFEQSVEGLIQHANSRYTAVLEYLNEVN